MLEYFAMFTFQRPVLLGYSQVFQHFSNSDNQPGQMEGPEGPVESEHPDSLTRLT